MLLSSLLILLLAPVIAVLALGVKASSPGPALYRGTRTGRHGIPFAILKFRSMVIDADKGAGTTSRNDARIFPFGAFLRRYKLDELPQLFNVLKGDMSFVGPRPELPRYTDQYNGDELCILAVRPGITDLSSLRFNDLGALIDDEDPDSSFERNVLPMKNKLRVEYVKRRGILLDIQLVAQTILVVIAKPFRKSRS